MAKIPLPGYEVSTDVLNGNWITTSVRTLNTYGHRVEVSQYFGMLSIDIQVDSHLLDAKQLEFDQLGTAWGMAIHLDAFSITPARNQLMKCHFPKIRFQDSINVTVTGHHPGHTALVVDVLP
jgi:hypothetical protein